MSAAALGKAGQFRKAADLIAAAIRTGHVEPWMYESLALAVEAAGGSRTEIARALLSSEDFARTPADLLALANFLARMDFEAKALDLCKKASRIEPTNGEAFALAMTIASRNDDLDALSWACPGILAIDWPAKHADVATRAARLAKTTIRQFEETGRKAEADALRGAVEAANVRDLVIRCSWSGDAEIDVLVEEPPGTVCGTECPRTPSGGTMVGTDTSESGTPAHQRCYSAAAAFPGAYRVRLRRLFGTIDADTVEVAITAYRGTPAERTETRRIPLSSTDHFLQVVLEDGRRRQPLPEAQLAQDVVMQRAISKTMLMQQLDSLAADEVQAEFAASRSGVAGAPATG
ncbi:MAG: hypothetical protein EBZ59_13465, partial [Planctomycetia bacterium]|nr:hypothetical protein [Planctomycetia bacterium]